MSPTADDVVARFDRAAGDYESWYATPRGERTGEAERRLLLSLTRGAPTRERVLEVGCGTGYFTDWLDEMYGGAVGLDRSRAMLQALRSRGRVFPVVLGDAGRLPFESRAFQSVYLLTTLEFLVDPTSALAEAVRVARAEVIVLWLNPWSLGALRRWTAPNRLSSAARRLTLVRARDLVTNAAGSRLVRIDWASTLFPGPFKNAIARLPVGDVLGLRVDLSTADRDRRRGPGLPGPRLTAPPLPRSRGCAGSLRGPSRDSG